jgi:hypothetical protein
VIERMRKSAMEVAASSHGHVGFMSDVVIAITGVDQQHYAAVCCD